MQMQMRGESATLKSPDVVPVETPVTVIVSEPRMVPAGDATDRSRRWERTMEMPKSEDEGGYPTLDRGWSLTIAGEEWGVYEILEGGLGMHAARLQRENRVGRTRASK